MRGNVALTGGAALAAGLLLGFIVDRLARAVPASSAVARVSAPPVRIGGAHVDPHGEDARDSTDVLERYRAVAAV